MILSRRAQTNKQTDGRVDGQTDATKRIIPHATRSIIKLLDWKTTQGGNDLTASVQPSDPGSRQYLYMYRFDADMKVGRQSPVYRVL